MKGKKVELGRFGLPKETNPVTLADDLKRGITVRLLSDLEEFRKQVFGRAKGFIKAKV